MTPVDTVRRFVERINSRDADQVAALLAEDHVFIDSLGRTISGRETMRAAWQSYYGMCPDYSISHDVVFSNGNQVAAFGEAGGTISGNQWRTPAAWLATVEDEVIKVWRVYADNKPVYDILAKLA
jgi:ketosteroid isomerase-like protein